MNTWHMCIGYGVFVAGTVGTATAGSNIFIMASIILLFCARMSAVCFLCAKSYSFKASAYVSVVVVVFMLAAYSFN